LLLSDDSFLISRFMTGIFMDKKKPHRNAAIVKNQ
jgi:hypothetical protein